MEHLILILTGYILYADNTLDLPLKSDRHPQLYHNVNDVATISIVQLYSAIMSSFILLRLV